MKNDAAVEKTISILRKQRTTYAAAGRPAQDGDRLTVDFEGAIDGQPFAGGKAENFVFALGEGRLLPEFDAAARGMAAGETNTFPLKFPEDYHGKDVAGKEASFHLTMKAVEEPRLPEVFQRQACGQLGSLGHEHRLLDVVVGLREVHGLVQLDGRDDPPQHEVDPLGPGGEHVRAGDVDPAHLVRREEHELGDGERGHRARARPHRRRSA